MPGPISGSDSPTANDSPVERSFVDAEGSHWRVYVQAVAEYDRRRGRSLIFASETAVRRVRDFPDNWMDLSDDDLALLSWKA